MLWCLVVSGHHKLAIGLPFTFLFVAFMGWIFQNIYFPFKRVNCRLTELKMEMQTSNEKLKKEMTKYLVGLKQRRILPP